MAQWNYSFFFLNKSLWIQVLRSTNLIFFLRTASNIIIIKNIII